MDRRKFLQLSLGAGMAGATAAGLASTVTLERLRWGLARYYDPSLLKWCLHIDGHAKIDRPMLNAFADGMKKHGITPERGKLQGISENIDVDIVAYWWEDRLFGKAMKQGIPYIVLEQGIFPTRKQWLIIAANGYNNLGKFAMLPEAERKQRWEQHFSHLLKPWQRNPDGHVVLFGQQWDRYLKMRNIENNRWANDITRKLMQRGYKQIIYRPHPRTRWQAESAGKAPFVPRGATLSPVSMEDTLKGAAFCVSLCTNAAADAVLAGYPTVALDKASHAYGITTHDLDNPFQYPDRLPWCYEIAGRHWSYDEVKAGKAWDASLALIYA